MHTNLSGGELLQVGIGFVGFAKDKIGGDLDLCARVFGRNQSLVGTEIIRVCVQCLCEWMEKIFRKISVNDMDGNERIESIGISSGFKADDWGFCCRSNLLTPAISTKIRLRRRSVRCWVYTAKLTSYVGGGHVVRRNEYVQWTMHIFG